MRLRPILVALVATAAAAAAAVPVAAPAGAAPAPVLDNLVGPLSFSVDHGTIVVTQSFAGRLTRVNTDGSHRVDLLTRPQRVEIGAVETRGPGMLFALSGKTSSGKKFARLVHRDGHGDITTRGSLLAFERRHNPDRSTVYGFRHLSKACAAKVPGGGGKPYHGIVESHPYATAVLGDGSAVVADAAGNDVLRVTRRGKTSALAVLPAQPLRITKARAGHLGLPACTAGHRYWFEPVPTDVEARGGLLYVTTLPGGPEDPSLGARGKVYTVNPRTGAVRRIGRGFLGATGVAVSRGGQVFVAELFANRVSTVVDGRRFTVASVSQPSALEWAGGRLWATRDTFGNASIIRIRG